MPLKGTGFTIHYAAWNTATGDFEPDDSANHTLTLMLDDNCVTPTNGPTCDSSSSSAGEGNCCTQGQYHVELTDAEANHDMISLVGQSSTPNVVIIPSRVAPSSMDIMFAAGMVWADFDDGTDSVASPYGTAPYPTKTIANAKIIADAHGLNSIRVKGPQTLTAAMEKYNFYGGLMIDTTEIITLGGFSTEHSSFERLVITGVSGNAALINDSTTFIECYLFAVTNINAWIYDGRVEGACSIRDGGYATFHNVLFGSGLACTLTLQAPTVCDIENMAGELTLAGMDGGVCSVSMTRGAILTIDNTCTAGTITVTGAGTVTDNSGGGCAVTVQVAAANVTQWGATPIASAISAANLAKLEDILDGTGGTGLTLSYLVISGNRAGGVLDIDNAGGPGIKVDCIGRQ
jgi:hypothetical protein